MSWTYGDSLRILFMALMSSCRNELEIYYAEVFQHWMKEQQTDYPRKGVNLNLGDEPAYPYINIPVCKLSVLFFEHNEILYELGAYMSYFLLHVASLY